MKKLKYEISVNEFESIADVPEKDADFIEMAEKAQEKAYAPYSNFKVGAVVVLANGAVYTGNNQENAAYPDGLCAERVAIFKASADNPGVAMQSVYITCTETGGICAPCGSCRQALMEYENKQGSPIQVWIPGGNGKILMVEAVKDILPFPFSLKK
ncbi:MAG TPA: cytidine deaminase [Bacteroidia bacterium]